MKSFNFNKFALAAGTVLACAVSSSAFALPQFTFDTSGTGQKTGPTTFVADNLVLNSSELITFAPDGSATAVGLIFVTSFGLSTFPPVTTYTPGSGNTSQVFFTFNLAVTPSGPASAGIQPYAVTALNFNLYYDATMGGANDATFVAPNASTGSGGTATIGSNDVLIAQGSLTSTGSADINFNANAVDLHSQETLNQLTLNTQYLTQPSPFYTFILDAFTQTGATFSQAVYNGVTYGQVTGTSGSGNFSNVPEPSSLALFGIAAVGLGLSMRRRKSA